MYIKKRLLINFTIDDLIHAYTKYNHKSANDKTLFC